MIFVFGSNTHGIHGAGAAAHALKNHGAEYGMGYGHYGNSFAIPTKGAKWYESSLNGSRWVVGDSLDIRQIGMFAQGFLAYARAHPELTFQVTRIGCGLAGFKDSEMAALFVGGQNNILYDTAWQD